ncbi:MAG: shikimate kinase [Clostridia bacterium]|nr:shikimate kinase [Clostridia bacterium]
MKKNIALIGFMGAGKTLIGQILAQRLQMDFLDTDTVIEKELQTPVPQIFAEKGEPWFRQKEKETVRKLATLENSVIATGGGVVLDPENIGALRENALIVCLSARPEVICERLKKDTGRPLLAGEDLLIKINTILAERREKYRCADFYLDTSGVTPQEAAEEIIRFRQGRSS